MGQEGAGSTGEGGDAEDVLIHVVSVTSLWQVNHLMKYMMFIVDICIQGLDTTNTRPSGIAHPLTPMRRRDTGWTKSR